MTIITKLKNKITDKDGNVIKEYSKKDLNTTQASESFFDDITINETTEEKYNSTLNDNQLNYIN